MRAQRGFPKSKPLARIRNMRYYFVMWLAAVGSPMKSSWNAGGRCLAFLLAASSIACLLFDFYGLCPMRLFTLFIFIPALAVLCALGLLDWQRGNRDFGRAVLIGL